MIYYFFVFIIMSLISNSKLFYINSRDRISGTDSDFLYQFEMPADVKFDHVCVMQACIPKSYYLIKANETFTLTEDAKSVNISLPVGNYTRKSFASTLQSMLTTNSPNGYTYTVTYPTSSTVQELVNTHILFQTIVEFNLYLLLLLVMICLIIWDLQAEVQIILLLIR